MDHKFPRVLWRHILEYAYLCPSCQKLCWDGSDIPCFLDVHNELCQDPEWCWEYPDRAANPFVFRQFWIEYMLKENRTAQGAVR